MYDMDRALGEPFVQWRQRDNRLIEDEGVKALSHRVCEDQRDRARDKLGIYNNDIHAGNIFVQQTGDNVTVHIMTLTR
jgi:hypothetical protein